MNVASHEGAMDIYTVLKRDHARIESLVEKLRRADDRTPQSRRRLLDELRAAVRAHELAEERSIFPVLLHDADAHDEAVRAREEQRDAESLIDELVPLEPSDPRFSRRVTELDSLLRSHFFREQQRLIPRATEIISASEAHVFARRVASDRERFGQLSWF